MKTFSKFPQTMAAVAVASVLLVSPVAASAAASVSPSQVSVSVQSAAAKSVAKTAVKKKLTKSQKEREKAEARRFYEPKIKAATDSLKRNDNGAMGAKIMEQERFDRKYTRTFQVKISKLEKDFASKYTNHHVAALKKAKTGAQRAALAKTYKAVTQKYLVKPRTKLATEYKIDERKHLTLKLAAIDVKHKKIEVDTQRHINRLKVDLSKALARINAS